MTEFIPRLSAGQMSPELAEYLRPRVERLGYLGEFFQCTAHQPKALLSFMALTDELRSALPANLTEVVALSVSCVMGSAYERVQHERLCLKLGFGKHWVHQVKSLGASNGGSMSQAEHNVQRLVLSVISRRGHDCRSELEAVTAELGATDAIAVLMLIGRYVTHALIVNALSLAPPVPSPLEEP